MLQASSLVAPHQDGQSAPPLVTNQEIHPNMLFDDPKSEVDSLSFPEMKRRLQTWSQAFRQDPNIFRGCKKVFLDLGSNRGTHIRKLFEPQKYPDAPYLKFFDEGFGPQEVRNQSFNKTGICAFGFEANPRWGWRLLDIQAAYAKQGWRVKWFAPNAVGSKADTLTFWLNDAGGSSDWGFSTTKTNENATSVDVEQTNFTEFMARLNEAASPGYRLMKMDIESAEYDVLPPLVDAQLLCESALNHVTIEWHWFGTIDATVRDEIRSKVESSNACQAGKATNFTTVDDESYLDDGKPLPE